jgi:protein NrfD
MEPGLLHSADWPLLIDIYFFLGGLAGGAFLIAAAAQWLDSQRYRDVIRVGHYIALLAIVPGPIILIVDLGLPKRFLHMLLVSKPVETIGMAAVTLGPVHFKPYSPMNVGAWALLLFSGLAFLAALDVFLVGRGGRGLAALRPPIGVIGAVFGLFVAAYPGVLLGATARPLFISAHWLGALFLAVGAATGAAAIAVVLSVIGGERREALARLMGFTRIALVVEALTLIFFVATVLATGSQGLSKALGVLLFGPYGIPFWLGAVVIGLLVPLAIQFGSAMRWRTTPGMAALVSVLVLLGGFLVKYTIIAAGQVRIS